MLRKISALTITFILGIIVGWSANTFINSSSLKNAYATSLIAGLEYDFKIIESLSGSGNFSEDVQKSYNEKFSSIVLMLKIIEPDYGALTGNPLQNICKLIEYNEDIGMRIDRPENLSANAYFAEISPIIQKEMSKIQRFTGGKNCNIHGEPGSRKACRYKEPVRCQNET